jgi:hypothetical protein
MTPTNSLGNSVRSISRRRLARLVSRRRSVSRRYSADFELPSDCANDSDSQTNEVGNIIVPPLRRQCRRAGCQETVTTLPRGEKGEGGEHKGKGVGGAFSPRGGVAGNEEAHDRR